jgi:hypothetical protein
VTTVEALEALRGEIDRRYNIERREEREELRARAAAKDVKASHEGTDTDKDSKCPLSLL